MSSHDVEYASQSHDAFENINEAWRSRAEKLAEWTFTALVNRVDVWGAYLPVKRREKRGVAFTRPYPSERGTLVLKPSMLVRHFLGSDPQSTIGLHAVSARNDGRWLVVDIDQKDPNASAAVKNDRLRLALRLVQEFSRRGLKTILEDSNGNGGFHVWCLFSVSAATVELHTFGKSVLRAIGDERLEVFPKQASVGKSGLGNWIRLPGRYHDGREYWSRFWSGDCWLEGADAAEYWLSAPLNDPNLLNTASNTGAKQPESSNNATSPGSRDEAIRALQRLDATRADDYDSWIAVGQALHATDQSDAMLSAWDTWSRLSKKFEVGACATKWAGFRSDGGRSVHTLRAWADEDDPPASKAPKKNESQKCFELVAACGGELWRTNDARAFVTVPNAGHREHHRVKSTAFRVWLTDAYMGTYGRVPAAGSLTNAIGSLEARALQRGATHDVAVRIGRVGDVIDLRHSCATLLLASGEHPKVVQERLGHASISLTLDTYSHVVPGMQERASERLDDLLRPILRVVQTNG